MNPVFTTIIPNTINIINYLRADTDSHGSCQGGSIKCENADVCLPYNVHCDGFNNCGERDTSDEADCMLTMTTGWDNSCELFYVLQVNPSSYIIKYSIYR